MNNTLHFVTPGQLDMRAITVFGLSAKKGENPIGFFGTGLKYAVAVLMAYDADLTIKTNDTLFTFSKHSDTFRDKDFQSIIMHSPLKNYELPFTTELGKTWEMWQVYRELFCNTIDEGGAVQEHYVPIFNEPDFRETVITVRHPEFFDAYTNREKYFLNPDRRPIQDVGSETMNVYRGQSEYMFYRSIRVGDLNHRSLYTWNYMKPLDLTEDRTVKYHFMWESPVPSIIAMSKNKDFIHDCVTAPEDTHEGRVIFSPAQQVSKQFLEVMEPISKDFSGVVNSTARALYEEHTRKRIGEHDAVPLNSIEMAVLEKAKIVCENLGTDPSSVPIIVTKTLGKGVLGLATNGKVFLSKEVFDMGTKMVAGTLYEELLHHEHRLMDMTRAMQNYLINKLMTVYEEGIGEPL